MAPTAAAAAVGRSGRRAEGAAAGGGEAAGVAESMLLLQAESTSAARNSAKSKLVFIDEIPEWYVSKRPEERIEPFVSAIKVAIVRFIGYSAHFKLRPRRA